MKLNFYLRSKNTTNSNVDEFVPLKYTDILVNLGLLFEYKISLLVILISFRIVDESDIILFGDLHIGEDIQFSDLVVSFHDI